MDGAVKVYRRPNTKKWQTNFQIAGHWIRLSTGKFDLEEAKAAAREHYLEYKFRQKNDLPVVRKQFADVARLAALSEETGLNWAGRRPSLAE